MQNNDVSTDGSILDRFSIIGVFACGDCARDDGDSVRTRILFHEKATRAFGGAEAEDDMATRVRGGIPLKVLFIGNSFTARNDLPGLIAQLAAARARTSSTA